jgi:hypothetical protein
MPQYLLATQTLVDIAKRDGNSAVKWIEEGHLKDPAVDDADVYISAVTPGLLRNLFRREPPSAELAALHEACDALIDRFVQAGQVVDVTKAIADTWADLMAMTLEYERPANQGTGRYSLGERLVFATAIRGVEGRPFLLVARRQPAHAVLAAMGLQLEELAP